MRPQILEGTTIKIRTPCGNMYCTLSHNSNNEPEECFITMGKAGGCVSALMQAISGLIRVGLKYKAPLSEIVSKLEGISCYRSREGLFSCIDGIAKAFSYEDTKT